MKKFFLLGVLTFALGISYGQADSVTLKKFNEEKWKEIVGNTTYKEEAEKVEAEETKEPEEEESSSGFALPGIPAGILQVIGFGLIFLILAFILYYVSANSTFSRAVKNTKPIDANAPVENIDEIDIEGLLRDALSKGDLRVAVRLHYLLLLKKLNEVGLIIWKKDKTNREYLSELYGRNSCYDDVTKLTLAYELVWYGERNVTSESFQHLSGSFDAVNQQLTQAQQAP